MSGRQLDRVMIFAGAVFALAMGLVFVLPMALAADGTGDLPPGLASLTLGDLIGFVNSPLVANGVIGGLLYRLVNNNRDTSTPTKVDELQKALNNCERKHGKTRTALRQANRRLDWLTQVVSQSVQLKGQLPPPPAAWTDEDDQDTSPDGQDPSESSQGG